VPLDDAQLSETTARGGMPGSANDPIALHFVTELAELWLTSCCRLRRIAARATESAMDIDFVFVSTRAALYADPRHTTRVGHAAAPHRMDSRAIRRRINGERQLRTRYVDIHEEGELAGQAA